MTSSLSPTHGIALRGILVKAFESACTVKVCEKRSSPELQPGKVKARATTQTVFEAATK
jgi:hypothetical protein